MQGIRNVRAAVEVVHIQRSNVLDLFLDKSCDELGCQLGICGCQQFACFFIDDVMRKSIAFEILNRHDKLIDLGLLHVPYVLGCDTPSFLDDEPAAQLDVEDRGFPAKALGYQAHADVFRRKIKVIGLEEDFQYLLIIQTEGAQDDRDRQFSAPVDSCEHRILRIEFEIQPRTPIRNDPSREQELA